MAKRKSVREIIDEIGGEGLRSRGGGGCYDV